MGYLAAYLLVRLALRRRKCRLAQLEFAYIGVSQGAGDLCPCRALHQLRAVVFFKKRGYARQAAGAFVGLAILATGLVFGWS